MLIASNFQPFEFDFLLNQYETFRQKGIRKKYTKGIDVAKDRISIMRHFILDDHSIILARSINSHYFICLNNNQEIIWSKRENLFEYIGLDDSKNVLTLMKRNKVLGSDGYSYNYELVRKCLTITGESLSDTLLLPNIDQFNIKYNWLKTNTNSPIFYSKRESPLMHIRNNLNLMELEIH